MLSSISIFKHKKASPKPVDAGQPEHLPFVIIGSGPVGLALALDLARRGHAVTLLTAFEFVALGSKAICFAKQSLDYFDRLGIGARVSEKGVTWNTGKLFWQDRPDPLYEFNLLPVADQKNPAFVNIQQYHVEDYLLDALEAMDNVDIRWGHRVADVHVADMHAADSVAQLSIETEDGAYNLVTDHVLACDGYNSKIRQTMGLSFEGRVFEDNFLIADIKFTGAEATSRPSERWFWFDPPFCPGGTALLHKQPDDVWRLDFQLGWNIDREAALAPENVEPFVRGMLGQDIAFKKEWYSVYTFQCRRMARFVHGPVVFVGDSAHLVSPFGARGANGGLADADNIAWKLDLVLRGRAPQALLQSYDDERVMGADENILNSSRATDFMTPKNTQSRAFRDAVLELSADYAFARPFINSGRLSMPTPYHHSPLSTPDVDEWDGGPQPGHPCVDAPLGDVNGEPWLLEKLGADFSVLHFGKEPPASTVRTFVIDNAPLATSRYDAERGATYLIRPDQVVAARWKHPTKDGIAVALARATGMAFTNGGGA
jgi:3-(3-hydroxy-phenyl)propionate hydroxylase